MSRFSLGSRKLNIYKKLNAGGEEPASWERGKKMVKEKSNC